MYLVFENINPSWNFNAIYIKVAVRAALVASAIEQRCALRQPFLWLVLSGVAQVLSDKFGFLSGACSLYLLQGRAATALFSAKRSIGYACSGSAVHGAAFGGSIV